MIQKYHNHTLQTKTRPDIIIHFIKQRDQFHFERKLYAQKMYVRFSIFCPQRVLQHMNCSVVCLDDTLQMESSILLLGNVALCMQWA